MDLLGTRGCLF